MSNSNHSDFLNPGAGPNGNGIQPVGTILHIDDDPNDTHLLRAAAGKANVGFLLHNVEDSEQAMAYLTHSGRYADGEGHALPDMILLDLKMPRACGFEVLKWIRSRPELNRVPVVVLSGSQLQDDIDRAYACGASAYQVKPLGFEELVQLIQTLAAAWTKPLSPPNSSATVWARP